jgi:hypothetical protein
VHDLTFHNGADYSLKSDARSQLSAISFSQRIGL